ncbi:septum formation inhibitor Maf [Winogradskyella ursingii]|uniref:septum formation inhibitor Maf n=1 Tax=Winogradskyella ursingii TaxID=2686079 RepID=UPI0015C9A127|nr:septum formation inhibitor Maf [Winogradskyella ursingii]
MKIFKIYSLVLLIILAFSCKETVETTSKLSEAARPENEQLASKAQLSKEFKDYWYAGEAEITSYKLEQARYGEMRDGTAVLIYVTEDFLPEAQVKADTYSENNISVLKLNATKNFNTGIYPYSIMQSTFYPVTNNEHAIKISASVQEWCGQVYAQINNRADFEVMSHSYFQGEADEDFNLEKALTENELWTKLRIDPQSLPTGNINIIPSLEYLRLAHKEIKAYNAQAELKNDSYTIIYPDLNRSLTLYFNPEFPYGISGWEETMVSGFGASAKTLTTKATKLESIKSAYWTKNGNSDETLRQSLKLQ